MRKIELTRSEAMRIIKELFLKERQKKITEVGYAGFTWSADELFNRAINHIESEFKRDDDDSKRLYNVLSTISQDQHLSRGL